MQKKVQRVIRIQDIRRLTILLRDIKNKMRSCGVRFVVTLSLSSLAIAALSPIEIGFGWPTRGPSLPFYSPCCSPICTHPPPFHRLRLLPLSSIPSTAHCLVYTVPSLHATANHVRKHSPASRAGLYEGSRRAVARGRKAIICKLVFSPLLQVRSHALE